jgi:hypothetical protein
MKIFFHTRPPDKINWDNKGIGLSEFSRLPVVGEYISLGSNEPNWHRVALVVHIPFKADYVAEVFCVAVNGMEAMKEACRT